MQQICYVHPANAVNLQARIAKMISLSMSTAPSIELWQAYQDNPDGKTIGYDLHDNHKSKYCTADGGVMGIL